MKKKCELCKSRARMYCESDQANLCWTCDAKVHAANFLVARHSRTLFCHSCNSLTHWTASGSILGPAFCVCSSCLSHQNMHPHANEHAIHNQVVPWSSSPHAPSTEQDEDYASSTTVHSIRMCRNVSDPASSCETRKTCQGEHSVTGTRRRNTLKRQQCSVEELGAVDLNRETESKPFDLTLRLG